MASGQERGHARSRLVIIPITKRHPNNTQTGLFAVLGVMTGLSRPYRNTRYTTVVVVLTFTRQRHYQFRAHRTGSSYFEMEEYLSFLPLFLGILLVAIIQLSCLLLDNMQHNRRQRRIDHTVSSLLMCLTSDYVKRA